MCRLSSRFSGSYDAWHGPRGTHRSAAALARGSPAACRSDPGAESGNLRGARAHRSCLPAGERGRARPRRRAWRSVAPHPQQPYGGTRGALGGGAAGAAGRLPVRASDAAGRPRVLSGEGHLRSDHRRSGRRAAAAGLDHGQPLRPGRGAGRAGRRLPGGSADHPVPSAVGRGTGGSHRRGDGPLTRRAGHLRRAIRAGEWATASST